MASGRNPRREWNVEHERPERVPAGAAIWIWQFLWLRGDTLYVRLFAEYRNGMGQPTSLYCWFRFLLNSSGPSYPGNLWFVRAIGCNVKCPTVLTINFPGTGPRNLNEVKSTVASGASFQPKIMSIPNRGPLSMHVCNSVECPLKCLLTESTPHEDINNNS